MVAGGILTPDNRKHEAMTKKMRSHGAGSNLTMKVEANISHRKAVRRLSSETKGLMCGESVRKAQSPNRAFAMTAEQLKYRAKLRCKH
jgi:hypothetical protein